MHIVQSSITQHILKNAVIGSSLLQESAHASTLQMQKAVSYPFSRIRVVSHPTPAVKAGFAKIH
jgi:hypothetical protein